MGGKKPGKETLAASPLMERSTKRSKTTDLVSSHHVTLISPSPQTLTNNPPVSVKNKIVDGVFGEEAELDMDGDEAFSLDLQSSKPKIKFPPKVLDELRHQRKNSLIVRLFGKTIEYDTLYSKAHALWKLQGGFKACDLGENYFLFTFESFEDCIHVYTEGPWEVMDHFLCVRKWEPNFKPSEAQKIMRTAVWVRFRELPFEFLHDKILYNVAKSLGKPIKVDHSKFARVCVEIDLCKPLCPLIEVEGIDCAVEYESLHSFCFNCSRSGHMKYINCDGSMVPGTYEVPDADFNDFCKDKRDGCFEVGQIWALYAGLDCMPRIFSRIDKIISISEFKLSITWLCLDTDDEDERKWVKAGLPFSCGNFKKGVTEITDNYPRFSHRVDLVKGSKKDTYKIYPRKGETWALFKNWDMNWHSDPESKEKQEFEFVEIISNYHRETGVSVAYLSKIKGFSCLFCRTASGGVDSFDIPRNQLFKFSHRVPSVRLSGEERDDVPNNSFELDPAALPSEFDEIDILNVT